MYIISFELLWITDTRGYNTHSESVIRAFSNYFKYTFQQAEGRTREKT